MTTMLSPTKARRAMRRKAGADAVLYYAIGLEVPPRRGAKFSVRYTAVDSAREGQRLLREKLARKKVGMLGELVLFAEYSSESVSLGGYIRRKGGVLETFNGDINRGAIVRGVRP